MVRIGFKFKVYGEEYQKKEPKQYRVYGFTGLEVWMEQH